MGGLVLEVELDPGEPRKGEAQQMGVGGPRRLGLEQAHALGDPGAIDGAHVKGSRDAVFDRLTCAMLFPAAPGNDSARKSGWTDAVRGELVARVDIATVCRCRLVA